MKRTKRRALSLAITLGIGIGGLMLPSPPAHANHFANSTSISLNVCDQDASPAGNTADCSATEADSTPARLSATGTGQQISVDFTLTAPTPPFPADFADNRDFEIYLGPVSYTFPVFDCYLSRFVQHHPASNSTVDGVADATTGATVGGLRLQLTTDTPSNVSAAGTVDTTNDTVETNTSGHFAVVADIPDPILLGVRPPVIPTTVGLDPQVSTTTIGMATVCVDSIELYGDQDSVYVAGNDTGVGVWDGNDGDGNPNTNPAFAAGQVPSDTDGDGDCDTSPLGTVVCQKDPAASPTNNQPANPACDQFCETANATPRFESARPIVFA